MSELTTFEVVVPMHGIGPASLIFQDPPDGPYEVMIQGVRQVTSEKENGKTTLRFQCMVTEQGPAHGSLVQVILGTDWSKEFNRKLVWNLVTSFGIPADQLQGNIRLTQADFIGKKAYILVRAAPEGELDETGRKRFANKNFLTRDQYDIARGTAATMSATPAPVKVTQTPAPAPAVTTSTVATPAPVPAAPTPSVPTVDLSSMFPTA